MPLAAQSGRATIVAHPVLCYCAGTKVEDARSLLESAVHFSESTFKAVWDGSIQEQPAKLQGERWGGAVQVGRRRLGGRRMFKAVWDSSIQEQPAKLQGEGGMGVGHTRDVAPVGFASDTL